MADIDKIKIGSTTYNISPSWNNITDKPSSYPPASHAHSSILDSGDAHSTSFAYSKSGLNYDDYTWLAVWNGYELRSVNKSQFAKADHTHNWDNISSKPITITQRNNDSPVSGAYAYGTYVTMRNTNNWFEIYAPHMGTSSSRVYMQTGWDNDRQGWKAIAWTSDIPTSLPASDVYAWAKASTKPSYSWSEINNKPSTFTPSDHNHNSLALTGTLDLKNSANGIKFNSSSHYITNIQVGSTSFSLSNSSGSTATSPVNFHDYSKGNGHWHIVTTVSSATNSPESIISCVSSVSSRSFTIKAKRIASVSGGNPTISIDYIAIKFS